MLVTNLLGASIPMIVKRVIDELSHGLPEKALTLLGFIGIIIVVMFGVRVFSRYFLIGAGRKIEYAIRMDLYRHLLTLPRSFYDVQQTGDLMSRLTNDLTALRMFLGGGVMLIANVIFAYCTILPLMAMLSWRLTLFAFALYPLVVGLMRVLSLKVKRLAHLVQDQLGGLTAVAQENFSGISIIQSYAKEVEESARFYDASMDYFDANIRLVKVRAMLYILIAVVSGVSVLIALGEGGREVIVGELGLSGLVAFMLYIERLSWPTASFGWMLSTVQQGIAAKERINHLLSIQPTITDAAADKAITTIPPGKIDVQNLSFRYQNPYAPEAEAPWVLKNISFTVEPGEMVAIVGPIGAGKTTLLNLLVRLYEPPSQSILIGGTPIEQFPLEVLRQHVTLMPQNSFLFSTTILHNIAYVNPECHVESIEDVAQIAQIHEEILTFPKSYQTLVGERGVTLSGGQRQRSALARTLLIEPQFLLLDDPFSNVDTQTESEIIQALQERKLLRQRTTIFASQRFSLVRQADWILVLNASGEMDAKGTHQELLESSALYRALNKLDTDHNASSSEEVPVL